MGLAPSKSRRAYPLVQPSYGVPVPQGPHPNMYLPPHLQTQQMGSTSKKKKKKKGSVSVDQSDVASAYIQGYHAGSKGATLQPPRHVAEPIQAENIPPVPPAGAPAPAPAQPVPEPNIATVLEPLPPPNSSAYGPPPPEQPLPPLSNPLPTPPRDLYELSPYNTLLNLPQTTALLTSNYAQLGSVPPPSYDRRKTGRGGLFRTLTGRGKKEDDVRFVPVFINAPATSPTPQPAPAAPAADARPRQAAAERVASTPQPVATPVIPATPVIQDTASQQRWAMPVPTPSPEPPPIRFSGNSYEYAGFLNYSPHRVVYQAREFPTAMHLHEAMKFLPENIALSERIRLCPDVAQVYTVSQDLVEQFGGDAVRSDWGHNYIPLMEEAVLAKFRQHANLREMLLRTRPARLIYADEQDEFWGEGPRRDGQNHLGLLLERVRETLSQEMTAFT
ncbi:S5A-REDUCTASE domain-containing protein [Mycena chlorophos]|uniref:S5A-REDUCTASE domain-containing protein n=1 Tax=Mycena chlorophos TaxID=658473 RepID=A0A8H6S089_MYCCL|nr:S5A-REDUCTASE domain-containing protein [Mycena chlorophos]